MPRKLSFQDVALAVALIGAIIAATFRGHWVIAVLLVALALLAAAQHRRERARKRDGRPGPPPR